MTKALWCTALFNISKFNSKKDYTTYLLEYSMAILLSEMTRLLLNLLKKTTKIKQKHTPSFH